MYLSTVPIMIFSTHFGHHAGLLNACVKGFIAVLQTSLMVFLVRSLEYFYDFCL